MNVITYATEFTREAGLNDFSDVLAANAQIDAVFSMDDETSIGVLQAIEEAGRTDIKVVTGGGGMQEYFNMMPENEDIWIQSALYSPSHDRGRRGYGCVHHAGRGSGAGEDHPHHRGGPGERGRVPGRERSLLSFILSFPRGGN